MKKKQFVEGFVRVANDKYKGTGDGVVTIKLKDEQGVYALYNSESRTFKSYMFEKGMWTQEEANDWVAENEESFKRVETRAYLRRNDDGTLHKSNDGRILAVASEEIEDRHGEVVSVAGWSLKNFKSNPVMLWMHNQTTGHNGLPIGKVNWIGKKTVGGKQKLVFEPIFDKSTDFNRTVAKFFEEGILNSFSVGFVGLEREGNKFVKQELLEISAVPVPALATARVLDRAKSIGVSEGKALEFIDMPKSEKTTVPYRAYDPAPESKDWDIAGAQGRVKRFSGEKDTNWVQYKEAFAWYDNDKEGEKDSYKLLHHDIVGDQVVTVWKGVVSAMAKLIGANGGVDMPEGDKRKVYNHLAKHYKQFGKEAPDFKFVITGELKEMFDVVGDITADVSQKEVLNLLRDVKRGISTERKNRKERERNEIDNITEALKVLGEKL